MACVCGFSVCFLCTNVRRIFMPPLPAARHTHRETTHTYRPPPPTPSHPTHTDTDTPPPPPPCYVNSTPCDCSFFLYFVPRWSCPVSFLVPHCPPHQSHPHTSPDPAEIFLKQIRISGISMGNQNAQERMVGFLDTTAIRPVISDTFPLSRLAGEYINFDVFLHHSSRIFPASARNPHYRELNL